MGQGGLSRVFTVLSVLLIGLSSQAAVLADPDVSPPTLDYALGYCAPEESAGHVSFHDTAPPAVFLASPAGAFAEEVVRLINAERRAAGLPPFKVNAILAAQAEEHSAIMRDQDCFDHQCSGELPSAERACNAGYGPYGWGACYVGETIAAGFEDPAQAVAAWMASPGHYEILMHGKLREIGVGYVTGGSYGHYLTADFGSQPDVLPVFINYDDAETGSREVTLTLTNEEVSGYGGIDYAHEVMVSSDPSFAGAQWELYTLHKSWTLDAGNGDKEIYVKYKDPSGYEVTSNDDILLNEPVQFDLELSTNSLSFVYEIGTGFRGPTTGRIQVENAACDSSMTWTATSSEPWLGLSPNGGETPGELVVSVDGFYASVPGNIQTTITVISPQAPDSPEEVSVSIQAVGKLHRVMLPLVIGGH